MYSRGQKRQSQHYPHHSSPKPSQDQLPRMERNTLPMKEELSEHLTLLQTPSPGGYYELRLLANSAHGQLPRTQMPGPCQQLLELIQLPETQDPSQLPWPYHQACIPSNQAIQTKSRYRSCQKQHLLKCYSISPK